MNQYSVIAAGVIAGVAAFICAPAAAHDGGGGWSVTIESQPQPYYYPAPPPVFYPQSPYVYGPPPSAFPPPAYRQQWPSQQYREPYADQSPSWREREWRKGERRENDRREDHSRDRWQDNDRPGPGARHDLPRWGYGEQRR